MPWQQQKWLQLKLLQHKVQLGDPPQVHRSAKRQLIIVWVHIAGSIFNSNFTQHKLVIRCDEGPKRAAKIVYELNMLGCTHFSEDC